MPAEVPDDQIPTTEEGWRLRLTPEQFAVARRGATEPPFSGGYWDTKQPGTFRCIGCGAELFSSDAKYDSGSGWPSFWEPTSNEKVTTVAIASDRNCLSDIQARTFSCNSYAAVSVVDEEKPLTGAESDRCGMDAPTILYCQVTT